VDRARWRRASNGAMTGLRFRAW